LTFIKIMLVVFNEILSPTKRYICLWSLFLILFLLLNNVYIYIEKVLKIVVTNNTYKIHI